MTPALTPPLPTRPGHARAFALRFAFLYMSLFAFYAQATEDFEWLVHPLLRGWNAIIVWIGERVLGLSDLATAPNGSGDKTVDWLSIAFIACVATAGAALWTSLDRRRRHDERWRAILRVIVRYTLAFIMLDYGVAKLFGHQFTEPGVYRLEERYGSSSPMGLMWTFMGSSPAYSFFSGAAEVLGAVLLLFRRTTLLGALVLATVLVNIVMLNFCYDVCVKINSVHYLVMCAWLVAPDAGRLVNVLVLHRPTTPEPVRDYLLPRRWMRTARALAKWGFIAMSAFLLIRSETSQDPSRPHTWYDGYWQVTSFERDGRDAPACLDDTARWVRIKFEAGDPIYARWHLIDGTSDLYEVTFDEPHATMTWTPSRHDVEPKHPTGPIVFRYAHPDADHLQIDGTVAGARLSVRLQRLVKDDYLLTSRGFHWVSEEPFNR